MAKNVLLIEYEQRDRNRVRSLLGPPEFDVTEAHDGEEGLAAFAPLRFDVVLLSGRLPRLSPTDVIRDIRNKGGLEAPPIVLLPAGYAGSNTKADAQKIGAFEIVPKPFTDEALIAAVASALEASGRGAKTVKVPGASLTSSDIFSDLLEELGRDSGPAAPKAPAKGARKPASPSMPAPPPRPSTDEEVERRLRDTLSGVRSASRPGAAASPAPTPGAPGSPKPAAQRSADPDIDRMLTETLRLRVPRAKPAEAGTPTPVGEGTPTASRRAEPREAVAPEGPDRFGQYELLEKIASGGMAELFRARRTGVEGFQKIVAIKKILPHIADNDEFITMFADEAKLAAQLNHPNIVHIYDLGKIQAGGYFIAMEYVEGTDLKTILRSGRDLPLPVPLAVYVASKVASALDFAHRRRDAKGEELHIVHRDVSPQNILISHEGEIKLCDFGIAKADRKVSQTESGSLKGKLQYMSPEQAWGKPIDHRSDLFSLGSVLHEMLTGERLFQGDSDLVILELVRKAEVYPPSRVNADVSPALDAIVLKALAREPDARYATGSEMLRDLESVLYSYSPAPGSADLAIYLDRLREARPSAEVRPAAAVRPPAAAPVPAAGEVAPVPAPASAEESISDATAEPEAVVAKAAEAGVFGSFSPARIESEKKGRTPLYIGIAAVVAAGVLLAVLLTRKGPAAAPATAVPPAQAPTAAPAETGLAAASVPTPAAPAADQRTVEQEVQRQLAAKRQEMKSQKALEQAARPTAVPRPAAVPTAVAARPTDVAAARVEPTSPPPLPTSLPPEPTRVVLAQPPPPREPAETIASRETAAAAPREAPSERPAPAEPEVSRGDLVGPGPGVVEPALLSPPRIAYPPMARQQKLSGRVVILVLVNEQGGVADARVQKGIGGRSGIDTVVLDAVRSSHFRAATKNGIPVKMWRAVVVDVKP